MEEVLLQRKQIAEKNAKIGDQQGIAKKLDWLTLPNQNYNLNTITYEYFRFKALSDVFSFADCSPDCSTCPDK